MKPAPEDKAATKGAKGHRKAKHASKKTDGAATPSN
jgi:hypothetical protein